MVMMKFWTAFKSIGFGTLTFHLQLFGKSDVSLNNVMESNYLSVYVARVTDRTCSMKI